MAFCDFKIARRVEKPDGVEVVARLYSGEEVPVLKPHPSTLVESLVTEYQRTAILGTKTFNLKAGATDTQIEDAITAWANKLTLLQPIPAQKTAFDRTK